MYIHRYIYTYNTHTHMFRATHENRYFDWSELYFVCRAHLRWYPTQHALWPQQDTHILWGSESLLKRCPLCLRQRWVHDFIFPSFPISLLHNNLVLCSGCFAAFCPLYRTATWKHFMICGGINFTWFHCLRSTFAKHQGYACLEFKQIHAFWEK